ncbi:probable rhamnogalacturonate lyase B [Olea europaea subsp. europaea]|uniref:rhamnogalacturonan endolyase n=1 Tax=Olea europaea subsp. europaea TaxID=158383 RepID=A0A8S0SQ56_OLEEU|nr:probable rhamnogalacturonate lyase B [Olea europaea subsp. europaea]
MGKVQVGRWKFIVWWLGMMLPLINSQTLNGRAPLKANIQDDSPANGVQLLRQKQQVVMNNGIVSITVTDPGGFVTDIRYKGSDNLLETQNEEDNRGYWDIIWNKPGEKDNLDKLVGTSFKVIVQNTDQAEISFISTWDLGVATAPLNVDKRYIMLRDSPGFYTYTVLERLKGWPAFDIQEARVAFKLRENKFHYMAMSDQRQRLMPMSVDRQTGKVLDYPEAVLLKNPTNPTFKREVDDKYLYSCDNKDNKVHGWVSSDQVPIGFWTITPSNEFRTGGPLKQDLTSHVAATMLSMFFSTHYAGEDLAPKFQSEEYWKKVFGPVYVYLNSDVRAKQNPSVLWDDAKHRMFKETASWPYNFPLSTDFLKSNQRGAVSGQLLVHDWFINKKPVAGASAYVGLAATGAAGSWQTESKGYQFWTQADSKGNFVINNVVPGTYSLFAWVPGTIGDYKYTSDITIKPGSNIKLRNVVFEPPRAGPTLWEIGIADRTAAEFFIPDTSPSIKIHSYAISGEKFREYGLWTRYKDLYPKNDLVYTIGRSDYRKDWFFAHVTRNVGNGVFKSTTWKIQFDLRNINKGANYTLHVALASATGAEMQVRFNNPNLAVPDFSTRQIGKDNAIARHGIHGLYSMYSIGIAGSRLIDGRNTIFLTQARTAGPFIGIMYDYLRFEGPALHVPASTINIGA